MIRSQVFHPPKDEHNEEHEEEAYSEHTIVGACNGNLDDAKKLRINVCQYKLSEAEIMN